ncbi:tRNA-uridine aminocarboxypropyltransferase [Thiomicrospira pelophila]|uniref:tRNA-uridine aminocarboxypropyltransferase n=1 Tax=Thiomicrospira pelophila TaxID=934 RepID=UPI00068E7289|nr:tRNA-uridine aminocarboxypropyltransferase [Thiomicrospira pelophila]
MIDSPLDSNKNVGTKRAVCKQCMRAQRACICSLVRLVSHQIGLGILQHPSEVKQAKGTAKLASLCLENCRIWVSEQVDDLPELQVWLSQKPTYLLYPQQAPGLVVSTEELAKQFKPESFQVLLLDGTWRKTHKILQLNPMLQALPRLVLSDLSPTDYKIRKSNRVDSLSTLEAIYYLLTQLEKGRNFDDLKHSFDAFVSQRAQFMSYHD